MGLIENDPRNTGYTALFLAITWYREIDAEQAWRLATLKSPMKPAAKLTSEIIKEIAVSIRRPSFKKDFSTIERRFRINRYDIFQELKRQKMKC